MFSIGSQGLQKLAPNCRTLPQGSARVQMQHASPHPTGPPHARLPTTSLGSRRARHARPSDVSLTNANRHLRRASRLAVTMMAPTSWDSGSKGGQYAGARVPAARNVLGGELACCCAEVRDTGIGAGSSRDGLCCTGVKGQGRHTVCVEATEDFLAFSQAMGNDLSTPIPEYKFPGLQAGDRWCLCAQRWQQALENGYAPKVHLRSTHEATLQHVSLDDLKAHAVDVAEVQAEADVQRLLPR